ncbi:SHOCT domain-containing protein [Planotetraspora sp. GP83]|uniref:SHOCT domain-containing protein n=1 Tax=Planotetraspora sp. GP83 TaxID=3156264 RepID=UPI0035182296
MLTPLQLVRRSTGLLVGLGAFACALTLLYLASSSVMGIGGSCGSGGPYVIATPCPTGIAWIVPVSIFGGIVALGVYAASVLPVGPRLTWLAWPALFLSLGYAFLDSSLGPETGVDWSFMVCAVLFILMGGVPLLFLANRDTFRRVFWGTAPPAVPGSLRPGEVRWTTTVELPGDRDRNRDRVRNRPLAPVTPEPAGGSGLVSELERLAALHRAGQLDDAEYSAAKKRLLNGSH